MLVSIFFMIFFKEIKLPWKWRNQPAWLQTILQSYSHQDSMVLAQKQTYRSVEQNRKPRDKSTHLWTTSEKALATHSSTLAWKIPWAEEPGRLLSMGSHRVRHDWSDLAAAAAAWTPYLWQRRKEYTMKKRQSL